MTKFSHLFNVINLPNPKIAAVSKRFHLKLPLHNLETRKSLHYSNSTKLNLLIEKPE